jgi:dephospho-CoA kinase
VNARRPLRVGLTGGIASGKSHCRRRFEAHGVPTIDADQLARDVVAPGTPGLRAVIAHFGSRVLTMEGDLDRGALGTLVFADAGARRALEAIVHPRVYDAVTAWFETLAADGAAIAVADIPLLYETGHEGDFDHVVVALCRPDQQLERLMARDGLDEPSARARIASQMSLASKAGRAHYVVDTSGTPDETDRQVDALLEALTTAAGPAAGRQ